MPNLVNSPSDSAAAGSPDDTIGGCSRTADSGTWCYPGFAVEESACESSGSPADTTSGCVVTSCEAEWTYPGCTPSSEASTTETTSRATKPAWPYSNLGATQPVVRKVTRFEEVVTWRYPGVEHWPAVLVEVTVEEAVTADSNNAMLSEGAHSTYWPESTPDEGYTIGGEPERAASTTATVRAPSAIRTGKRKKSKELNPMIMMAGVVGGGVVGLFIGYCILYVIMVKIMGRGGDFSNFWQ